MTHTAGIDNRGIPPLAGVCSYEAAARPGFSVERTVARLKRFNYVGRRLHDNREWWPEFVARAREGRRMRAAAEARAPGS